jgi:hypothetical protein
VFSKYSIWSTTTSMPIINIWAMQNCSTTSARRKEIPPAIFGATLLSSIDRIEAGKHEGRVKTGDQCYYCKHGYQEKQQRTIKRERQLHVQQAA